MEITDPKLRATRLRLILLSKNKEVADHKKLEESIIKNTEFCFELVVLFSTTLISSTVKAKIGKNL